MAITLINDATLSLQAYLDSSRRLAPQDDPFSLSYSAGFALFVSLAVLIGVVLITVYTISRDSPEARMGVLISVTLLFACTAILTWLSFLCPFAL